MRFTTCLLVGTLCRVALLAPLAGVTAEPTASPSAAAVDAAPAVAAATAATAATAPMAKSAPARHSAAVKGGKALDRIDLDATQITGNKELPKVMYVVPWKRPDLGDYAGRPPNSLLDEILQPVDRDVFRRQNRYYAALQPDTRATSTGDAATAKPAPADHGDAPKAPATMSGSGVEK